MVRNSRGYLSGNTRKLMLVRKSTVSDTVRAFKVGDRAAICVKGVSLGGPHLRYQGKIGKIVERRGNGYVLSFMDGNKPKKVVTASIYLKKM